MNSRATTKRQQTENPRFTILLDWRVTESGPFSGEMAQERFSDFLTLVVHPV